MTFTSDVHKKRFKEISVFFLFWVKQNVNKSLKTKKSLRIGDELKTQL